MALNKISLDFQSFHGLNSLPLTGNDMREYLNEIYDWALINGFANSNTIRHLSEADRIAFEKHKSVRLLGTFFADSFDDNLLKKMIRQANKGTFDIKILMLDPFRDIAKKRGDALGINPVGATTDAIKKILLAIKSCKKKVKIPSLLGSEPSLYSLLKDMHHYGPKSNVEVRFYHSLTDSPIYLISQFAFKGLILEGITSDDKPWMVFVDSITQKDDMYDQYSNNFNLIFNNYSLDEEGNLERDKDGSYKQTANHSRKWPIGINLSQVSNPKLEITGNPENEDLRRRLLEKVAKDQLDEVIESLIRYSLEIERASLESEIYSLSGRLKHLSLKNVSGEHDSKDITQERNQIRSHMIQLIYQI